jgi:arabinoxylan arabinofuranohydrolase
VTIALETPYGTRVFANVAPGANAYQSFATRTASTEVGSATVRAAGTINGTNVTTVLTAEHPGVNCPR